MVSAKFLMSAAERIGVLFFHSPPPPQHTHTLIGQRLYCSFHMLRILELGPDHPHPNSSIGQKFHSGRGKLSPDYRPYPAYCS